MPTKTGFAEADLLISPKQLAHDLGAQVQAFWSRGIETSNPHWTAHIKQSIHAIALKLPDANELEVIYTNPTEGVREFLCDVVWWHRSANDGPEFMALAAEVEWGSWSPRRGGDKSEYVKGCIMEDFWKLVVF